MGPVQFVELLLCDLKVMSSILLVKLSVPHLSPLTFISLRRIYLFCTLTKKKKKRGVDPFEIDYILGT